MNGIGKGAIDDRVSCGEWFGSQSALLIVEYHMNYRC